MKKHSSKEALYERLKVLANIDNNSIVESNTRNLGTLIDYKRSADNIAYGIVKENHNFYIKKGSTKVNPNVSDFTYIGGLSNITNYQYQSLAEADKQRNMFIGVINETFKTKVNGNTGKKIINEGAEEEINLASKKIDDLDSATNIAADDSKPSELEITPSDEVGGVEPEITSDDEVSGVEPETTSNEKTDDTESDTEVSDELAPEDQKSISQNEIEKLIGKVTNKIRKTELEPAETKSYVNSFLSSFKDKFDDIDIEDRKTMADKILKVVPDEEIDDVATTVSQNDKSEVSESEECSECGSFVKYAESMGYDNAEKLKECGEDEVTSLISNYGNHYNDGTNDGDLEGVALVIKVVNPEILNKLKTDYGHEDYAEKLQPQVDQMNENSDDDNMLKLNELFGGLGQISKKAIEKVGQAAKGIKQTYYAGEKNAALGRLETLAQQLNKEILDTQKATEKAGQEPINIQSLLQTITSGLQSKGAADLSKFKTNENTDPSYTEVQPTFASDGQTIGVVYENKQKQKIMNEKLKNDTKVEKNGKYTNKSIEQIDEELNALKKSVENYKKNNVQKKSVVSESEQKLRKYVRTRLEEKAGLRKSRINENSKSVTIKKLDKLIDEQIRLFESDSQNEGLGDMFTSNAKKFEKLNPNDLSAINTLFYDIFKESLKVAARRMVAREMTPEDKYNVLKQGYQLDKLRNPSFGKKGNEYFYAQLNLKNPFAGGGTGGNFGYGGTTGM